MTTTTPAGTPVHPRTRPLNRWVTALSFGFNNKLGTPTAFALSLAACVLWIALIPIEGFGKWDLTAGLVGNDIESTVEWFFGIAVLIVGVSVAAKQEQQESIQHHQTDQMAKTLDLLAAQSAHIAEVEDRLTDQVTVNTELTQQVHDLTAAIHQLVSAPK